MLRVQATLRANDTDAIKISKELWSKMNPTYDAGASRGMSTSQEAMEAVFDPDNIDGIHTIKASKRNNRRRNDFTDYVEANARYANLAKKVPG